MEENEVENDNSAQGFQGEQEGQGSLQAGDPGTSDVESDGRGSTTSGDGGQGESREGVSNAGDSTGEPEQSGDEPLTYEGVTAEQFEEYYELVDTQLHALNAACLVLVVALFACFGSICVQTLMKSLYWEK